MKKKWIKAIRKWPEPQSVKDIQVFLGFINFYKRFIRNFNKITTTVILMLQITYNKALSIQATENKRNQTVSANVRGGGDEIGRNIENLSPVAKLAKSKKPKMTNFKTDFFTFKAKKAFTHL